MEVATASFGSTLFLVEPESSKWVVWSSGPLHALHSIPLAHPVPVLSSVRAQEQGWRPLVCWKHPSPSQNTPDTQHV